MKFSVPFIIAPSFSHIHEKTRKGKANFNSRRHVLLMIASTRYIITFWQLSSQISPFYPLYALYIFRSNIQQWWAPEESHFLVVKKNQENNWLCNQQEAHQWPQYQICGNEQNRYKWKIQSQFHDDFKVEQMIENTKENNPRKKKSTSQ